MRHLFRVFISLHCIISVMCVKDHAATQAPVQQYCSGLNHVFMCFGYSLCDRPVCAYYSHFSLCLNIFQVFSSVHIFSFLSLSVVARRRSQRPERKRWWKRTTIFHISSTRSEGKRRIKENMECLRVSLIALVGEGVCPCSVEKNTECRKTQYDPLLKGLRQLNSTESKPN